MARSRNAQNNFKDAVWYEKSRTAYMVVLGAGGIGSNTVFNLARTLPASVHVVDFDLVEEHNVGTQFFHLKDLGQRKVSALKQRLDNHWAMPGTIYSYETKITEESVSTFYAPIIIAAFDNMEARKIAFDHWKSQDNRELFIDGRLRANQYEVFSVVKGSEEKYEETLFLDEDIPTEPCTFKQTAHVGMMIGTRITALIVNYLSNKYSDTPIYSVPFHFKELLELCHVEIKE